MLAGSENCNTVFIPVINGMSVFKMIQVNAIGAKNQRLKGGIGYIYPAGWFGLQSKL